MNPFLPERVAKSIDRFTGRAWLVLRLLEWWEGGSERLFLLTGGPGTGKSMIMAWLAGHGPAPAEPAAQIQLSRLRATVRAVHFCRAASRNVTPQAFGESIANQLTETVSGFGDALAATLADRVQISVTQSTGTVAAGGSVSGVSIGRIDLGAFGDELSFDRAFTQPLKKLYACGHSEPMLLLIDALDEAQTYTGQVTLPDLLSRLADLPPQVRLLATTRDEPRVLKFFREVKAFDLIKDADPDVDDVRTYAERRLADLTMIEADKRGDFAQRLSTQAGGVFLYAAMVLDELLAQPPSALPALDSYPLPKGLSGLYHAFLTRELGRDDSRWFDLYEPLLGLIAVAQGDGLTTQQLADLVGKDVRASLRTCKQYLTGELPDGPFRPFHKSFADFLLDDPENTDFHIAPASMHQRIANHYLSKHQADWSGCERYGLRYLAVHLTEGGLRDRLFELVADPTWVAAKQIKFHDPAVLLEDLGRAIRVAQCEAPPAVLALVRAAAISGHLLGVAPPLIVDVLARAGQLRRARLLAENTAFPLDRCVSLSWLALRAHEQGDVELASRCMEDTLEAASRVTGSYRAMSASFSVDAALGLGRVVRAQELALEALSIASDALSRASESQRFRDNAHSIFWTSRAVRAAFGKDGLAGVRQLVGRYDRQVWNLDLQIASMAGDLSFLEKELQAQRSIEWHPSVRSNVALALADAGQIEGARELCFDGPLGDDHGDNAKRMAWACSLCNDFDRAFEIAEGISHPEEAMRALHRIQQVAQAMSNRAAVRRAAELAAQMLVRAINTKETQQTEKRSKATGKARTKMMAVKSAPPATVDPADFWRLEAWTAHLLSIAGQSQEALALAESICGRNIASVEANSLCYPTSYSAGRRHHVVPSDSFDVAAFRRELASVTDRRELLNVCKTCERLAELTALNAWGEMRKALAAMADPAELNIAGRWLDAVAAAARLGRAEVGAVVDLSVFVEDKDRLLVNKSNLTAALEEGDRVLALSNR